MKDQKGTMDIEEAARHLGVSTKTLRRWVAQGKLQARKVSIATGARLEFDPQDLEELSRERIHPRVMEDEPLEFEDTALTRKGQDPGMDTNGHESALPSPAVQPSLNALPGPQSLLVFEDLARALIRALDTNGHGRTIDLSRDGQLQNLPDLLTMEEVVGYLRVSPTRVRDLLQTGKLRGIRGMGRGWRVKREDLRRFMEEL